MSLDFQLAHINLFGQLDTKTDEKLVVHGDLLDVRDAVRTQRGNLKKRNGYTALGRGVVGASDLDSGNKLAVYRDELLLFDEGTLYSYSPGVDKWVSKGSVSPIVATHSPVIHNNAQQSTPDMASVSGVAVYVWADTRDSNSIRCSVVDATSGVPFQSDVQVSSSGTRPRVVAVAGKLVIIFADGTDLKARRVDPETPQTLEAEVTLRTDLDGTDSNHDADESGDDAIFAYYTGSTVTVAFLTEDDDGNLVVGNPLVGLPSPISVTATADKCLALEVDSNDNIVYVAYHNTSSGVSAFARSTLTLAETFAPVVVDATLTQMDNITVVAESSQVRIFYEQNAAQTYNTLVRVNTLTSAGSAGTSAVFMRSVGLAHKAIRYNSVTYVGLTHDSTLQSTYFLANSSGFVAGRIQSTRGGGLTGTAIIPRCPETATGVFEWLSLRKTKLVSEVNEDNANTTYTLEGVSRVTWDFTSDDLYASVQVADALHVAGGVVGYYDGVAVVEHGFHVGPENVTVTPGTSGGSMADGTYGVAVIYQWIDNRGRIHRSLPYVESVVISGGSGSGKIDLTIPTLRISDKSNVTVEVYTTEANGLIYYRVTANSGASHVDNDATTDTVSFTRTVADASITTNEILYTQGLILENVAPDGAQIIATHRSRVFIARPGSDQIQFSKTALDHEGLPFSDLLTLEVPPEGGNITAMASLDDKLVIFKRGRIYVLFGDAPNNAGQQSTLSDVQLVTTDVGALDQRGVVLTADGLMFKADTGEKGIYTLGRGLSARYDGGNIEAYNASALTSAVLIPNTNQVRFTHSDDRCLVWDYEFQGWSTFRNHKGVSAVAYDNIYYYLRSDGTVYKEATGVYTDDGVDVRWGLTTAWLKFAGLQGYQRVRKAYLLGSYASAHKLRFRMGYDYQAYYFDERSVDPTDVLDKSTWGEEATWGAAAVWGGVEDSVYQWEAHLKKQKCQAIRFDFEELTGSGEAFSLSNLALEVGLIPKGNRLRAGKKLS